MKLKLLLLLTVAISLLASCNSSEPTAEAVAQPDTNKIATTDLPEPETNETELTEYIEWGSLKLNNQLLLGANLREIEALFGKPDSVVVPDYDNICHNCHFCTEEMPPFKEVYIKGVNFEQLNDSLVFWSADFSRNKALFLQSDNMRLDHRTTLTAFQKRFPDAVKEARDEGNEVWVNIATSNQPTDGAFILVFDKKGYLTQFSYWFPC